MSHKIDIGIACGQVQYSSWWGRMLGLLLQEQQNGIEIGQIMTIGSALPDFNKNNIVGGWRNVNEKGRASKTDANRVVITKRFLGGDPQHDWKAEWLMWFDDDTVPPDNVISRLLAHNKDAVAGLYFNPNPPKNPIAYVKNKDGVGYDALYNFPYGALMQVDSVGMGCTLVHRSVYERIQSEFEIFVRPNGSYMPIHKSAIYNKNIPELTAQPETMKEIVINGWYCMRIQKPDEDDDRAFPFYAMEYGRTEDHHFWELAAQVGIRPWVDTTITCGHIKPAAVTYKDYKDYVNGVTYENTGAR